MLEANKELVRRYFEEIFNRKNLDACDELIAEDYIENAVAPFGQSAPGRVAVRRRCAPLRSGLSRSTRTST